MYVDTSARNDLPTAVDLLARRGRTVLGMNTAPTLPAGRLHVAGLLDRRVRHLAGFGG
ncbi:hypothetical protein ABTZ58_38675 [Streptomyces sp. NPDC094143]|uniref:hypothetical protein n=1 Tax=Streptomyces sp. NPDC094143 TaxID=3155310 RepID=UPI0033307B75